MKKRARTDDNHDQLRRLARELGASWFDTHQLGRGFPDAVIGLLGENYLLEIKDGRKPPSRRRLTADEQAFIETWNGSVHIIESRHELLDFVMARRMRNRGRS